MQQSLLRERRFTGDVAHELRTPLAGIKTQLQVARLTQGGKAMHALVQAEKATDRLQRTLDQLLLLARVEGDGQLAESTHLPVAEINNMALSDVQHLARQHQVTLRCNDGVDENIHASAILLSAALRNLLENAIRHTPENTLVTLSVTLDDDQLCWAVEDEGPGVSEKLLTELTR
ncbi:two-component sensor histidine kinase, partial [Methylophaga nitratireducenticrescens]